MLSFKDVPVPFIFIHIPKTAGTSIKKVLKDNGYGYSLKPNRNARRIFRNPGHFRIKHYKHFMNLYPVGFTFEDAFKFSVIRNPFERVVSYYYFIRQKNKAYKREYTDENFHSWFERVLIGGEPDISNRPKNVDTLVPCTHFLTEPINQILRFENLKEDFALLKKNLRLEIILPHENKIEHPCYKNHITTSERAWIEKNFKSDFEKYGYEW